MIFGLDPTPEPGVERIKVFEIVMGEQGKKLHAHGAKPTFLFSFALRLIGASVDEGDAELGADEREVPRAVGRPVIDVESFGNSAAEDGGLQHRQEGGGTLTRSEGGVRNNAGGVVEHRDQVRFAFAFVVGKDAGSMHHVTHPKLVRFVEGEAPTVFGGGLVGFLTHKAVVRK